MYLLNKGLTVSRYLSNALGNLKWVLENRAVNVQSYLPGVLGEQSAASPALLARSALLLADIQNVLSEYPGLKLNYGEDCFSPRKDKKCTWIS